VALIGDACGALTLLSGQGSHMAMAGAYMLAHELARNDNHRAAFTAYEKALKPQVVSKQRQAAGFAKIFVRGSRSMPWLRRLAIRAMFSRCGLPLMMKFAGTRGVLPAQA
jgi:2-polyprenyl-6-methoxyphenol hydroxylase-like FAD-dependent oxidoreductase